MAAATDRNPGPGPGPKPGDNTSSSWPNITADAAGRRHGATNPGSRGTRSSTAPRWWEIHLFRGMVRDVRRRIPYYWSDWVDAWDYRVIPATVYMYFANILPALAFSLDMFTKTDMQYGVNEVLLASVLGAVVFSLVACQPLVIVGVTGPITVFNYTVYDIVKPLGTNYLAFMCWIGLWSVLLHWVLAATNSCNWLRYVTRFPCDIFGFYVAFIYLQKGVQVLERFGDGASFYLSLSVSLLVFAIAYALGEIGRGPLFRHPVRVFLKDYGTPLTVIFFTGFVHLGRMRSVELERLPTSRPFYPTADRAWLVNLTDISVAEVFLALPFAILLTTLFWFDHNVSSLIAQGTEFPLRKPAGFHWDIFLLGLTTGVAGILGLPFPNGLIPQAPFHTESLCVTKVELENDNDGGEGDGAVTTPVTEDEDKEKKKKNTKKEKNNMNQAHDYTYKRTHVVEQRVSNLAQGLLTLGTATGPLLIVLHLIPQAVLAGLFFIMGYQALEANGITAKLIWLARDRALTPPPTDSVGLGRIRRRSAIWVFVAIELLGFAATFAITQTIAAVGFPVFILALIPVRALIMPRVYFRPEELALLDAPTASPLTMENVGGGGSGTDGEGEGEGRSGGGGAGGVLSEERRAEEGGGQRRREMARPLFEKAEEAGSEGLNHRSAGRKLEGRGEEEER